MKIIFDTLGADNGSLEIIKGALAAQEELNIEPILVGDSEDIKKGLAELNVPSEKYTIVHAPSVISNEEDPALAIRRKKDSSIVVGIKLLKDKEGDAFISAGSTGGILAGGTFIVGRIPGVKRAFLPTNIPGLKGETTIVDSGANMDVPPEMLLQFAEVGTAYVKSKGIENPRVGLINVGVEAEKGNHQVKEAYKILKESDLNFVGNVEARNVALGVCDLLVCDGFIGNVILKNTEGNAGMFFKIFEGIVSKSELDKESVLKLQKAMGSFAKKLSYEEHGGTILLGLNEIIVKAHGSSSAKAIKNAAKMALKYHENDLIKNIEKSLKENLDER